VGGVRDWPPRCPTPDHQHSREHDVSWHSFVLTVLARSSLVLSDARGRGAIQCSPWFLLRPCITPRARGSSANPVVEGAGRWDGVRPRGWGGPFGHRAAAWWVLVRAQSSAWMRHGRTPQGRRPRLARPADRGGEKPFSAHSPPPTPGLPGLSGGVRGCDFQGPFRDHRGPRGSAGPGRGPSNCAGKVRGGTGPGKGPGVFFEAPGRRGPREGGAPINPKAELVNWNQPKKTQRSGPGGVERPGSLQGGRGRVFPSTSPGGRD